MNPNIPSGPCGQHFAFKRFQLEDYARGALHDGLILGHDTGGGKSLALFIWPALKVGFQRWPVRLDFAPGEPRGLKPLAPVLLVVPGDLHHKTIHEDAAMLKAKVTILDSQATFSPVHAQSGATASASCRPAITSPATPNSPATASPRSPRSTRQHRRHDADSWPHRQRQPPNTSTSANPCSTVITSGSPPCPP